MNLEDKLISGIFGTMLGVIYGFFKNYPVSIIILTIVVKTILIPLAVSQYRYTKNMNVIQPMMKELQEKYKNDKEALNVKMMELYKEHKVNPFSGCLPILIQLPIFIALFNTLKNPLKFVFNGDTVLAAQALGQHFFWITDLSKPDFISNVIPLTGMLGSLPGILPILSALTTYWQMASMNKGTQQQNDQMKMMTQMMPIVILVTGYTMPAGLMIYWTVSNIYQIVQQHMISNFADKSAHANDRKGIKLK